MRRYACEVHSGDNHYVGSVFINNREIVILEEYIRHHEAMLGFAKGRNDEDRDHLLSASSTGLGYFISDLMPMPRHVSIDGGSCSITVDGVVWTYLADIISGCCVTRTEPEPALA